jgi:hypothetical protein
MQSEEMFLYCSRSALFMTKAIFVPWKLLNEKERGDIERVVARADAHGIIHQQFEPLEGNPDCYTMTKEFADINQVLSYWDMVVDDGSMLDHFLSSEHEQTWLKASIPFNEIELIDDDDTEYLSQPVQIFQLLKTKQTVVKAVLHLC